MRQSTRKNRRDSKRRKIKFVLAFLVFFLLIGLGAALYTYKINKPLYISPLPNNNSVSIGQNSDADLLKNGLNSKHMEYEKISKSNDSYVVIMKNKSEIILSTQKDIKSQLASLQFILTRLTMEGKLFTQLDLRYDKPVIRLK
jgi:hypothetical protein